VDFAKEEEFALKDRIQESSKALWAFFDAALADYRGELPGAVPRENPDARHPNSPGWPIFGPDTMGRIVPPCFSSFLQRNGLGRGILFLKFGVTSLPNVLAGIKARYYGPGQEETGVRTLFQRAVEMARNEARSELLRAFNDFSENLRSHFLYSIVDQGCLFLLDEFRTRTEMAQVDFANLLKYNSLQGGEKSSALETLTHARQITEAMLEELDALRRAAEGLSAGSTL